MRSKKPSAIDKQLILRDPVCFLAFGFGIGLAPVAPGTWGTLLAVPLYLGVAGSAPVIYGCLVAVLFLAGIPLCATCERRLQIHDHPGVVWDEIVGLLITLWGTRFSWPTLVLGFVLFRLFDVLKPWPIRALERRVRGGFGIMLDDALAGACAWTALQFLGDFVL